MLAGVNSELDVENVNISPMTSPRTSSNAITRLADEPRCEKTRVTVVKVGTRQSARYPLGTYNPNINGYYSS